MAWYIGRNHIDDNPSRYHWQALHYADSFEAGAETLAELLEGNAEDFQEIGWHNRSHNADQAAAMVRCLRYTTRFEVLLGDHYYWLALED